MDGKHQMGNEFGRLVQCLRLALSNGPNRVDVPCLIHEDGNRPSFGNIVFFRYWTMDKVQNLSNPNSMSVLNQGYALLSELFA
jgi:hypothetical protein